MTDTQPLAVGDRARSVAAAAIATSVLAAAAFTAFVAVSTQLKAVRVASPWQDDPYDTVVSFSKFAVPALAVLILLRSTLNRRREPVPRFRAQQLVRACLVCTVLIVGTVVVDWIAVAVQADHALWDGTTWWLVGALATISVLSTVGLLLGSRAARTLPLLAHSGTGSDWLDDARELLRRNGLGRLPADRAAGLVRRHLLPAAGLLSLIAAGGVVGAMAVGESWTDPMLIGYALGVAWTSYFAFCLICNASMRIATRPPVSQGRHAAEIAAIAGCLAAQVAVAFHNSIPAIFGRRRDSAAVGQLATVTTVVAVVTAAITFSVLVARPRFTAALYAAYARRLRKLAASGPLPRHVGLIMDGNRRRARQSGLANPSLVHRHGAGRPALVPSGTSARHTGRPSGRSTCCGPGGTSRPGIVATANDHSRPNWCTMAEHRQLDSPTKGIPMTDLHVVATIPIKPEAAEQAAPALTELAVATRAEEGCLSYDLYESLAVPGTFVTVELWRSQQDLDAHLASPHVQQALTDYAEHMTGPVAVHPLRPA